MDNSWVIAHGPRLLVQTLIASLMDLYSIKYYRRWIEDGTWIIMVISFSSFVGLNLPTRTLANSIEASLFIIAFYYYQFNNSHS